MPDTLAVLVHWATDAGNRRTQFDGKRGNGTYALAEDVDLVDVLRVMAQKLEADGLYVFRPLRVYTRRIPLVGGQPSLAIAGPVQRVPESLFHVQQEMLQ